MLGLALASKLAHADEDGMLLPPGETKCTFGAWLGDTGGLDVAVRSEPSEGATVLGTLPGAPGGDRVYEYSVQFDLVAARDGWVKTFGANEDDNIQAGAPVRPDFRGEGWMSSAQARPGIQSRRGFAGPSTESRRILDFPEAYLTETAVIEHILGYDGDWIQVQAAISLPDGSDGRAIPRAEHKVIVRRAWFRGVCSISETICDMPSVDTDAQK